MTSASLVIRPAIPTDIDAVLEIERASFADPWSRDAFEAAFDLDRMRFLVADDAHLAAAPASGRFAAGIVGYVVALLLIDEAEIANIAVAPEGRGRGIGGRLLDHVTTDAAEGGVRSLYLEVRESNTAARALYQSRSFAQVGRRRGYYRHPVEDALVLRRDLGTT